MTLLLAGCASMNIDVIAPPPAASASSQLSQGRQLYVTKCAKCHTPEPVKKYSRAEWHKIMPEMVEETNLNAADTAALQAYIDWVLAQR